VPGEVPVTVTLYVVGFPPEPPPPLPPLLTPAHAVSNARKKTATAVNMVMWRMFAGRFHDKSPPRTRPGTRPSQIAEDPDRFLEAEALVEMLITTSTAEVPGVTAVAGLKLHCDPAGKPAVHARETAPVKDEPTGCTASA
jgi:hypothetical protein